MVLQGYSLFSPKLFLSPLLTVLQKVINKLKTEAKYGQMQIRTKFASKTKHFFFGRWKQRTMLPWDLVPVLQVQTEPVPKHLLQQEVSSTAPSSTEPWAAPPLAFLSCQPQSHPLPWPRSENSSPCAAESPLKACSENVGGHLDKVRPYTEPLLHHTGHKSIRKILGALWAPGWHFQTHPRQLGAASEYDTNFMKWFYNLQGKQKTVTEASLLNINHWGPGYVSSNDI